MTNKKFGQPLKDLRSEIHRLVNRYSEAYFTEPEFVPGETAVPVSGKVIGGEEISNLVDASLDAWLTTGRFNDMFESELGKFLGVKHVLTVNSGSSANLVAFSALTSPQLGDRAIKRGDEVITVAAGFPTTVNPIIQYGAVPVFVDIDPTTYNINASLIEEAITSKTKAIMLAHTLGNPFDVDSIKSLCARYNLWLIEDCCDALGSLYKGERVGTFGDIATLSFYPAHHITMGEGGAVFTNNPDLARVAESFRDWGRDCYCKPGVDNTCGKRFCWKLGDLPEGYDHKYIYSHLGYNLKITDFQAACGLAQLRKLERFIKIRRDNFNFLYSRLSDCQDFLQLPEPTLGSQPSWFGFPVTVREDGDFRRLDLLTYLEERKIGTRLLFAGNLVRQPYMRHQNYRVSGSLAKTDVVMANTFWLGVYPGLTEPHLSYVSDQIKTFLGMNF